MSDDRGATRAESGTASAEPTRAVLLDFGGTLTESRSDMRPAFEAAAQRCGAELPWPELEAAMAAAWEELWPEAPGLLGRRPGFADLVHERALRRIGVAGPIDRMVDCMREEAVAPRWHRPYPEVDAALAALGERGVSLHLLSNNVDYLPHLVRNLGWEGRFASITYSQELGVAKPDPRLFRLGLARTGEPAGAVVHLGDSWESDYLGARAAGIRAVWLNRTGTPAPFACEEVHDLRGFVAWLDRLRPGTAPEAAERPSTRGGEW